MSIPEERYVGDFTSGSGEVRDLKRQLDAHIGKGGNAHAIATPEEAGFMSQSDKEKLDTVENGATQNQTDEYLLSLSNATGDLPIARVDGLQEEIDRISGDSAAQLREDLANDVAGDLGAHLIAYPSPDGEDWNVADLASPDKGAAMVRYGDGTVADKLDYLSEEYLASSSVNMVDEVINLSRRGDQMYAAKGDGGSLIVAFARGDRVTQYRMIWDADGLLLLKSARVGPLVQSPSPNGVYRQVSTDGDIVHGSNNNSYAASVGDKITGEFTGVALFLHHFANTRGGVWRFTIDGDTNLTSEISTYGDSNPSIRNTLVLSGLADTTHTFEAEFVGDDPFRPPVGGSSRGWFKYDPETPMTISEAVTTPTIAETSTEMGATLIGDYVRSVPNHYTTVVGTKFLTQFDGTGFYFHHRKDSLGGVWEFTVDGGNPIQISTYADEATVASTMVVSELENGVHSVEAVFIGSDPDNPPDGGIARGWIRYDPAQNITGTSFPRPPGDTIEMLAPSSVLEWAIRARPAGTGLTASWNPRHSGEQDVSRDITCQILINGQDATQALNGLAEYYQPVSSVTVRQGYKAYVNGDEAGAYPMWDGITLHEFLTDGRVRFKQVITTLRALDVEVGYTHMLGASNAINAIENGAMERFDGLANGETIFYSQLFSGARAEYLEGPDRYMVSAQSLTPASTWRFASRPISYTNVREDAVKTYVRAFYQETLPSGMRIATCVDYVAGDCYG